MRRRVSDLLQSEEIRHKVTICTFHAFGLSILREHAECLGRDRLFSVLDEDDRGQVIRRLHANDQQSSDSQPPKGAVKDILQTISELKENALDGKQVEDDLLQRYRHMLQELNAFDFDDLIHQPATLMKLNSKIRSTYRNRYRFQGIRDINETIRTRRLPAANNHRGL